MKERASIAYTFTGQGSQEVGMWKGLRRPRLTTPLFNMADRVVGDVAPGVSLSELCTLGPEDLLNNTSNAQPAILTASLAALKLTKHYHPKIFNAEPKYFLGHSVGEYSALAAAGIIDQRTAIYLVRQRGLLMEFASQLWPGKMVALHGFESEEQVINLCMKAGVEIANSNGPGQLTITGGEKEVNEAVRMAKEQKMKTKELLISGGFHSSRMAPIQPLFREIVTKAEFKDLDPQTIFVLNATGFPASSVEEIKEELVTQLVAPVRWWKSIEFVLNQGVTIFLEFGPKPILTGLLKRIDENATGIWIGDYKFAQELSF